MENQSIDGNMAHLDFRQAFSSPADHALPVVEPGRDDSAAEETASREQKRALATRLPRLHQADRTTFLFAILVFVGGLFCALFFFNGAEILRAAAAWSREFLYPRPPAMIASDRTDLGNPQAGSESPASLTRSRNSKPEDGNRTAPFGRDLGSLYPQPFNDPSGAPGTLAPGPGSLLSDLTVPAPGGDALLQSLNQAVENMARATNLFANSTATLVKTVVQASRKADAQVNSARQIAQNVASRTSAQESMPNAKRASSILNRPGTQATRSTLNLRNNLGQGLGGLNGVGGMGDAAGSLGGAAGGLGGAAGGAMGGLGLGGHGH